MPLSLLPSLLLAILLVGYTPGPANLFALHCSMKCGVRKTITMWLGLLAGFSIAAVIAALVTHFVGSMMGSYVGYLKYIGCAYILYLSWQIYRSSGKAGESHKTCNFVSGMIVQLTNAKIILFDLMELASCMVCRFVSLSSLVRSGMR